MVAFEVFICDGRRDVELGSSCHGSVCIDML